MNEKLDALSLIEEIKDEQWWKLVELKKFCLSEATDLYDEPEKIVKTAQEYMDFLMGDFKPVVTWYNSEHPTSDVMAGWYKMMDNAKADRMRHCGGSPAGWDEAKVRAFNEWDGKLSTTTEHPQPEHEKVLDLERIADNEPLCWSIFVICHEGFYYMHNIDIRIYDSMLDLYVENGNNDLLVRIFNDGIIHLFKQSEIIPIINEHLEKFLEPYWIDKE